MTHVDTFETRRLHSQEPWCHHITSCWWKGDNAVRFWSLQKASYPRAPPDFFADFPYGHSAFKNPRAGSSWLWNVRSNWALWSSATLSRSVFRGSVPQCRTFHSDWRGHRHQTTNLENEPMGGKVRRNRSRSGLAFESNCHDWWEIAWSDYLQTGSLETVPSQHTCPKWHLEYV